MRQILAARRVACWLFIFVSAARVTSAQTWDDSVTLDLVNRAVSRRAQQQVDTGLVDYQARAHGYVTFLAQLGEGFPTPPKIVKADELELEVYWHAPNQSKQRIVGRRDTLLLPTDIAYHRDHLAIVQNNFGPMIRIGEGDEVRDVPHPLSSTGVGLYDFALSDSFAIGAGTRRIRVYELKVRPKDDTQPRIVGALYLDPSTAEVVRMNVSFTRAALIDNALEELSVVLENRLVAGRYWLPSRQEIEIRRKGEWLDYPVRGIIRGRWEIGDYRFNIGLPPPLFTGPEVVQEPPSRLRQYKWSGRILDSLPPDVRAVSDPDIQRVQAEARELVHARALQRAQRATLSARSASDFVRSNRVEGLALGAGMTKQFGSGLSASLRGRYGIDDATGKGGFRGGKTWANGASVNLFASRDFRDVGDVAERSTAVNSIASQEFGSDDTDPYLVQAAGITAELPAIKGMRSRLTGAYEWQSPLAIHAHPVVGAFERTIPAFDQHASRYALELNRPPGLWLWGTELSVRAEGVLRVPYQHHALLAPDAFTTGRGVITANIERPFGDTRLVMATTAAGLLTGGHPADSIPVQELVFFGGPVSAPGYDYHSIVSRAGFSQHVEWRVPAPFIPFSLGRFGRVPGRGSFAPFLHVVGVTKFEASLCVPPTVDGTVAASAFPCNPVNGFYPSVGAAYLTPFDLLRLEVARGLRHGRWTFNIDLSREFWSIL